MTNVVSLMKSIVYSMNGKKIPIKSSLTVTKYLETMLIENCVKHLTIIPNNFSRISQLQKNNGNLSRKLTQTNTEKIAKLKEGHNVISDEKSIANCLNNCFARLGLYKGEKKLLLSCLLLILREMNSISGQ